LDEYIVAKITNALNEERKSLKGSKILILGIAYKKDVDDMRESPGIEIINILKNKGSQVDYHDPFIPSFSGKRRYPDLSMKSIKLDENKLNKYDCVVIITNHSAYDYDWIVENSKLVIDTRNATASVGNNRQKIIKA